MRRRDRALNASIRLVLVQRVLLEHLFRYDVVVVDALVVPLLLSIILLLPREILRMICSDERSIVSFFRDSSALVPHSRRR